MSIADNIWLTFKSRIVSETRLTSYDRLSNVMISTMSLMLIGTSLFEDELKKINPSFSKLNVLLSIGVFVLSIILAGCNFKEKAAKYRECYLKLEALYATSAANPNLSAEYQEIINAYQNHEDRDYKDFVINRKNSGQIINDPNGNPIKINEFDLFSYYFRKIMMFTSTYILPAIMLIATVYLLASTQ